jgi:hypothetical protein
MSVFTYTEDGERTPFDPLTVAAQLAGCLLCGRPHVAMVGVFVPETAAMRAVVMRLRRRAPREHSDAAVAYGLCRKHARRDVTARVETVLTAMAGNVTVQ